MLHVVCHGVPCCAMLAALIRQELAKKNLTYREAAARSGGMVDHANLNKIATGKYHHKLTDDTLRGIALAIGVPLSRVRKEAATTPNEPPLFEVPPEARYLTLAQRRAVLAVISSMLSSQG